MEETLESRCSRLRDQRRRSEWFFSTLKEGLANARALAEAKNNPSADELIKAVTADLLTADGRTNAVKALRRWRQAETSRASRTGR